MRPTIFAILLILTFFYVIGNARFIPKAENVHFGGMTYPRRWGQWCSEDYECGLGFCQAYMCRCHRGYITWYFMETCAYEQRTKLTGFLVSFFVGYLGIDWFVLSRGNAGYIVAGIIKLLVFLGCVAAWFFVARGRSEKSRQQRLLSMGIAVTLTSISVIWWLTDWIRVLSDVFYDGNGAPLKPWGFDYYDRMSYRV